jgi:autotransporter-associated beta strand protein
MKKHTILILSIFTIANIFAQDIYDWKDTAPDANWKRGVDGARWTPGDLWDQPPATNILRFNNNHELNMTNNVASGYSIHQIIFGSSNTSNRTISGNNVNFDDYSGFQPKIENSSTGEHSFDLNITVGSTDLQINPVSGNLNLGGSIDTNGHYIKIWGDNANKATFNGIISNTGGFSIEQNSMVVFNAENTYTGGTNLNAGTLEFGIDYAIKNNSNLNLNGGTISTKGFNAWMGTLALVDDATIQLGIGRHDVLFANSQATSWTAAKTLIINGWGTGTEGQIYIGDDATGLTAGQLAQIHFTGYPVGAYILTSGEIVPVDHNSDAEDTGSQPGSALLNSINESIPANAYNVLDFYISDYGDSDGLPTKVTNIRIKPYLLGGTPNTADWTDNIGGVVLKNESGPTIITTGAPTITDSYIDIPIAVGDLNIADGDFEEIGLYIYLNSSNLEDGKRLKFMIDADDHGFTVDSSGSLFVDTFPKGDFNSNNFTIQVTSTELRFTQQPSNVEVNTVMSPDVIVSATDASGNIDVDFNGVDGTVQLSVIGSTFDAGATDTVDAVAGVATFDNLIFDTTSANVTLETFNLEGLTETTSNPFIVGLVADDCSQLFISEYGHYYNGIGTGANYIEIYNPTGSDILLNSNYQIIVDFNGGSPETIALSGTIVSGDVFVISDDQGNVSGVDQTDAHLNYSGDDTILFQWNGGSGSSFATIDVIGDGGDPGSVGFTVNGIGDATNNNTLIRKKTINRPNVDWATSSTDDWIVSSYTQANLQFHHSTCNYYPCSAIEETAILIDFDINNVGWSAPSADNNGEYIYFDRVDESEIGTAVNFTNESGHFFAAQDTDNAPVSDVSPEFYVNNVDITGLENLVFSILIAEDDSPSEGWDPNTSMHVYYDIDNTGVFKNLLWVESTHPTNVDYPPAIDIDFDGTGNTTYTITDTFELFSKNIPELGNEIDLKIVFSNLNNGTEDIAIDNIKVTGDRVPTTTWSAGAWTGGIAPIVSTRAVINDDYNTSTASIITCNCEVNSGKTLRVDAGTYLLVAGAIDNQGIIIVENEGSLVQLDDHATNTGGGAYQIHKTTPQYADYDYTYWSSPVDNETIGSVLSGSHANYRFKLSTADFLDMCNGYGHPQSAGSSDSFDDDNDDWVNVAAGTVMEKGKGYIAMGEGSDFPLDFVTIETDNTQAVIFDGGKVNNGVISVAVTLDKYNQDNADTPGTHSGADSFHTNVNLIGNPYPSAIDIAALRIDNANAAILEGTFYVWTHDTQIASGGGPWAHNFTNDDYATITVDATGIFSQVGAGNGTGTAASRFIASGQGFMANVTGNGEVTFNNAMRVIGENDHFLKQGLEENQVDRICLNFTQTNSFLIRQALVGFYDTATDAYQAGQDGMRLENGQNTDFYSLIPNDSRHFAIQNLATFNEAKTVSLGIEIAEAGSFEIGLDYVTGVFEEQDVYLMDNRMGILHNLSQLGIYKFDILDIELGELNNRFELRFVNGTTSTEDSLIDKLLIYPNPSNGLFNISYPTKEELTISIFDISGKLVKSINNVKDKQIDLSGYAQGIYFAKIDINGIQTVKKIVLK